MSGERLDENRKPRQDGLRPRLVTALSVLFSAAAVAAVGLFCALFYPILTDLRAERVRGQNGAEESMLGFWSILVLAVLAGCICCVLSWTLTYLDSQQPDKTFPSPPSLRSVTDRGFVAGYSVAALNGVMAALTVIWSLS